MQPGVVEQHRRLLEALPHRCHRKKAGGRFRAFEGVVDPRRDGGAAMRLRRRRATAGRPERGAERCCSASAAAGSRPSRGHRDVWPEQLTAAVTPPPPALPRPPPRRWRVGWTSDGGYSSVNPELLGGRKSRLEDLPARGCRAVAGSLGRQGRGA